MTRRLKRISNFQVSANKQIVIELAFSKFKIYDLALTKFVVDGQTLIFEKNQIFTNFSNDRSMNLLRLPSFVDKMGWPQGGWPQNRGKSAVDEQKLLSKFWLELETANENKCCQNKQKVLSDELKLCVIWALFLSKTLATFWAFQNLSDYANFAGHPQPLGHEIVSLNDKDLEV